MSKRKERKKRKKERKKNKSKRRQEHGRDFNKAKNIAIFIKAMLGIILILFALLVLFGILSPDTIASWFGG